MGKTVLLSCSKACASCRTEIGCGDRFRNYMDTTFWHPECFCCYVCDRPIRDDLEFSVLGKYHPYHKPCGKELHHLRCDVCNQQLFGSNYTKHRFFNQKLCSTHWSDGTPYCSSCQRLMPRADTTRSHEYSFTLGDGRILCSECHDSAITDEEECRRLYTEIQGFFFFFFADAGLGLSLRSVPLGQLPHNIPPLLMVEREALNEAEELRQDELWHLPPIRGVCLVERAQADRDGSEVRPRKVEDASTVGRRLTYKCDVIAILILYGLPRLMMGSLLAHEMMHAWLAVNGYYPLSPEVEEGVCQVVAHMWLDSEITSSAAAAAGSPDETTTAPAPAPTTSCPRSSSGAQSYPTDVVVGRRRRRRRRTLLQLDFEKRLGYLFKGQIEFHASPVYGEGFRACRRAVLQYGLRRVLDHVKSTGRFPAPPGMISIDEAS